MDLKIVYKTGETVLVEIKPHKETLPPKGDRRTRKYVTEALTYVKNKNKWKAAAEYAKDQGWGFQIWTEKELEAMKILPKRITPLKPFRRKKK